MCFVWGASKADRDTIKLNINAFMSSCSCTAILPKKFQRVNSRLIVHYFFLLVY